jgi:hypothetical protein
LGLFLFEIHVTENKKLKEYIGDQYGFSEDDAVRTWLIASLLHDHAYPISYMFRVAPLIYRFRNDRNLSEYEEPLRKLKLALESSYLKLFSPDLDRVYSRFSIGDDDPEELRKLALNAFRKIGAPERQDAYEKGDPFDHGVLAAVNISSRLKKASIDKVIRNSLNAIALHNSNEPIKFGEDPIAFLLVLCDELQEWGREIALFPEILIETSCTRIGFRLEEQNKLSFAEKLHVSFRFVTEVVQNKKIGFNLDSFMDKKNRLKESILIFDTPNNPKEICFDPPC